MLPQADGPGSGPGQAAAEHSQAEADARPGARRGWGAGDGAGTPGSLAGPEVVTAREAPTLASSGQAGSSGGSGRVGGICPGRRRGSQTSGHLAAPAAAPPTPAQRRPPPAERLVSCARHWAAGGGQCHATGRRRQAGTDLRPPSPNAHPPGPHCRPRCAGDPLPDHRKRGASRAHTLAPRTLGHSAALPLAAPGGLGSPCAERGLQGTVGLWSSPPSALPFSTWTWQWQMVGGRRRGERSRGEDAGR